MNKKNCNDFWCPYGRISIQTIDSNKVNAVSTGAFNIAVLNTIQSEKGTVYQSARCCGEICPLFDAEAFSKGRKFCDTNNNSKHITLAGIIVSLPIVFIGVLYAFHLFGI